jgi:hypothetical protein
MASCLKNSTGTTLTFTLIGKQYPRCLQLTPQRIQLCSDCRSRIFITVAI